MTKLKRIMGTVGSGRPSQKPRATPARAAWATVSLKKDMRRAVTKTPMNPQSGPRKRAVRTARSMKGSMSMAAVGMRVLVLVRGEMNAVGLS